MTAYTQPGGTMLDLDLTFTAPNGEVGLGGTSARSGVRFLPTKPAKVRFEVPGDNVESGQAIPWVAFTCTKHGKEKHLQLMCHPILPGRGELHTDPNTGNMGYARAATIRPADTLRFRYRLLLLDGPLPLKEKLRLNYQNFINPPKVEMVQP